MTSISETDLLLVAGGTKAALPAECKGMKKFYDYALAHPAEHPSPAAFCASAKQQVSAPAPSGDF